MKIDRDKVIFDPKDPRAVELIGKKVWAFDHFKRRELEKFTTVYIGDNVENLNLPFRTEDGEFAFIAPIEEPKCEFTEGQRILVSDDGNDWKERIFVRHQEEANRMNFRVVLLGCEQQWHKTKSENLVVGYRYAKPLPEKKYRPFANAEEFAPHRDDWFKVKHSGNMVKFQEYADWGVIDSNSKKIDYEVLFHNCLCEDGTPCGVEVE